MKKHTIRNIIISYILFSLCISFTPIYSIPIVEAVPYNYYYVSCVNGSDGDSGLTLALAWKTLDHAWETMTGPCTLYILAGTYDEKAYEWNDAHVSGNATNPTIIRNYENDYVVLKEGNDTTNSGVFQPQRVSHVKFMNLNFRNVSYHALYFESQAGFNMHNLTVSNCTFENISCSAVRFHGATEDIYDVLIENCDTNDTENAGSGVTPSQETFSFSKVHRGVIRNNTMRLSAKNNIDLKSGSSDGEVYNNSINTTHTCGFRDDTYKELGGGIYIDGYSSTSNGHTVYNNTIWGNKTGIHIGAEQNGGSVANNTFYNNIVCINGTVDIDAFCFIFDEPVSGDSTISDTDVFHNTFYGGHSNVYFQNDDEDIVRTNLTNNIMDGAINYGILLKEANYVIDCYNNLFTGNSEYWGTNAVNGSPVFVTPGSDFHLQGTSDAINNGTNAGITIDFDGNTRPFNTFYDIGAYEYSTIPSFSSGWSYYRTITIESDYIDTSLTNFPLMVYIPSTITPKCDGGDSIRFLSTNNVTHFNYEIEYWHLDGSYVWVNISEVIPSGSDYTFLMYYNNSEVADNQNKEGVWDSNYQFVHHMDETSGNIIDSTRYDNDGTKVGSPSYQNTGQVGEAIWFDGANDYFSGVLAKAELNHNTAFFEFWAKPDSADTIGTVLGWFYTGNNRFYLGQTNVGNGDWRYGWGDQYETYGTPDTNFHYLSYIVTTGEVISAYVDTTFYATENSASFSTGDSDVCIGAGIENTGTYRFYGTIDEVRISNSSRNTSWSNASFHTMNQTTGFMTWGSESAILPAPTGFIATTLSESEIFLNWTKAVNTTHTYLVRKTGGYPFTRTDGTNLYNDTGVNYTDDTGLSIMTVYYYNAWGFNSTNGNWSSSSSATNHTGPANPTSVDTSVRIDYLNITWTRGAKTDNTTVVRKATGYPTSPTDGTEVYNSSGIFYNDTAFSGGYYRLFSWNDTVNLFSSGINAPYGSLTIRVYDENTSDAITGWDVFITNEAGTETYENTGNNNPLLIDIDDLPTGANTAIKINATDYDFRLYYMDIYANNRYTLDAYLPPENISELYVLIVIDENDQPVSSATMQIQQYINETEGYKNVSIRITDVNGHVEVYLIPGSYNSLYKIIIDKIGYETEIADYVPDATYHGMYYPKYFKIRAEEQTIITKTFGDICTFTGEWITTNNTLRVYFYDDESNTTNVTIRIYEVYDDTLEWKEVHTYGSINTVTFYNSSTLNTSRMHKLYLEMNHTTLGHVTNQVRWVSPLQPESGKISGEWINQIATDGFGVFNFDYVNFFFIFIPCILIITLGGVSHHPGLGVVIAGGYTVLFNWRVLVDNTGVLAMLITLFFLIGFIVIISKKGRGLIK